LNVAHTRRTSQSDQGQNAFAQFIFSPYSGLALLAAALVYGDFQGYSLTWLLPVVALVAGWSSRWSP
jgi:hypothetical protein